MNRLFSALIIIIFLTFPSVCFSTYKIELNNGYSFITESYWKEDDLIKLIRYGGVIGLDPSLISNISWIDELSAGSKDQKNQIFKAKIVEPGKKNDEKGGRELIEPENLQSPASLE